MNGEIFAIIGTGIAILTLTYTILRNFKIDIISKIDRNFEEVDKRFDVIEKDIKEIRTSLNRMEGAFYSKDCCMLKHDDKLKRIDD